MKISPQSYFFFHLGCLLQSKSGLYSPTHDERENFFPPWRQNLLVDWRENLGMEVFHPGQLSTFNPSHRPMPSNHVYLNWLAHDKFTIVRDSGYWSATHLYSWFYLWIWCSYHDSYSLNRVFMNRLWTFAEWNHLNFMVRLVSPGWQYSLPLNVWSLRKPLYKNILVTTSSIFASVTSGIAT